MYILFATCLRQEAEQIFDHPLHLEVMQLPATAVTSDSAKLRLQVWMYSKRVRGKLEQA